MRMSDWSSDVCSSDLDEVVNEGTAREEENRGDDEEGQESALLMFVGPWRHEHPDLDGDNREGEESAGEKGDLDLGEELFLQRRIDQPPVRIAMPDLGQWRNEEIEDRRRQLTCDSRSEERRGGKELVSTGRSGGSPYH